MARFLAILALFASVAHAETPRNWYVAGAPTVSRQILYFKAPWCGPCKESTRNIYALNQSWKVRNYNPKDDPHIAIVDLNDHPDIGEQYGIDTVPAFVLFEHDGTNWKKIASRTGVLSTKQIAEFYNTGKAAPAAQMSVRDDAVCQCGCGKPGCKCQVLLDELNRPGPKDRPTFGPSEQIRRQQQKGRTP